MPHSVMPWLCMPWEVPQPHLNPVVVAGAAAALVAAALLVVSAFVFVWASGRRLSRLPARLAVVTLALAAGATSVSSWAWGLRFLSPTPSPCLMMTLYAYHQYPQLYATRLLVLSLVAGIALMVALAALVGSIRLARRRPARLV